MYKKTIVVDLSAMVESVVQAQDPVALTAVLNYLNIDAIVVHRRQDPSVFAAWGWSQPSVQEWEGLLRRIGASPSMQSPDDALYVLPSETTRPQIFATALGSTAEVNDPP